MRKSAGKKPTTTKKTTPNLSDKQTETHKKPHSNKTQPKTPTEGVSNLYCICAGNSLLVIKEMGSCCACPPDMPKELGSLRNQGNTVNRNTHLRKSCYCIQPTQAARPRRAGHAGTFPEPAKGMQVMPDKESSTSLHITPLHLLLPHQAATETHQQGHDTASLSPKQMPKPKKRKLSQGPEKQLRHPEIPS